MTRPWSITVGSAGDLTLTLGPAPRKAVVLPTSEARALANALLSSAVLAEGLGADDGQ